MVIALLWLKAVLSLFTFPLEAIRSPIYTYWPYSYIMIILAIIFTAYTAKSKIIKTKFVN
jgi:hypothetical protein